MRTPGSRTKEKQPLLVPPCSATQVGVCPGLPYGLGWAAGSFPSLPCCLPSPLPSSESPCIPCPRWNKQGSRLWGRAIGALPCLHHAMTPLLFPLLLASLLPSSSCNKGECGGGGAQREGGLRPRDVGVAAGRRPLRLPGTRQVVLRTIPLPIHFLRPVPFPSGWHPQNLSLVPPLWSVSTHVLLLLPGWSPFPSWGLYLVPPPHPPLYLPAGAISGLRRT